CVRPASASNLGSRVSCSLLTPSRITPHRGCDSAAVQSLLQSWERQLPVRSAPGWSQCATVTSRAMAHTKAAISRAMATTTWLTFFPRATQAAVALTESHLGLPTDVLDSFRHLRQA